MQSGWVSLGHRAWLLRGCFLLLQNCCPFLRACVCGAPSEGGTASDVLLGSVSPSACLKRDLSTEPMKRVIVSRYLARFYN